MQIIFYCVPACDGGGESTRAAFNAQKNCYKFRYSRNCPHRTHKHFASRNNYTFTNEGEHWKQRRFSFSARARVRVCVCVTAASCRIRIYRCEITIGFSSIFMVHLIRSREFAIDLPGIGLAVREHESECGGLISFQLIETGFVVSVCCCCCWCGGGWCLRVFLCGGPETIFSSLQLHTATATRRVYFFFLLRCSDLLTTICLHRRDILVAAREKKTRKNRAQTTERERSNAKQIFLFLFLFSSPLFRCFSANCCRDSVETVCHRTDATIAIAAVATAAVSVAVAIPSCLTTRCWMNEIVHKWHRRMETGFLFVDQFGP